MRFAPRRREWIIGSAWRALKQTKLQRSFNAISYPDEPGLREPDSLHFFRIFKEQPNQTYCAARAVRWALSFPVSGASGGANRDRTGDLLLAKQALSQLSYGPCIGDFSSPRGAQLYGLLVKPVGWWVWVDLNHRPHAYQACALTS